jgi:hypothetical protein
MVFEIFVAAIILTFCFAIPVLELFLKVWDIVESTE